MRKPDEIDILDYFRVIWKRAWLIALLFFLATAAAFTVSSLVEKVYESEITFRIMGQQKGGSTALSHLPSSALIALGVSGGERELLTYSHILKSKSMIGRIIDALPYLVEEYPVLRRSGLFAQLKRILKPYNEDALEQIGEEEFRKRLLLKSLRESVKVRQLGGDVLSVRVRWNDPKSAADIASELGKALIEYDRIARQKSADRTLSFIQNALKGTGEKVGAEKSLTEAEGKLRDFKKRNKTVVMQEEARKLIEKLANAEDVLSSTIIARKTTEARLADIQKQLAAQEQMALSARTVADNPVVQYLQREMARLEIQTQSLAVEFGEANPELRDMQNLIAEYEKRIRKEIPKVVQETTAVNPMYQFLRHEEVNCLINITISEAKGKAVQKRVAALEEKLMQIPDAEMQLIALTRESETYSKIYLTLRQSENEAQLARQSIATNISILDEPEIPLESAAPKIALNTAIGGVIGLMLGLGLVFFLDYVKRVERI